MKDKCDKNIRKKVDGMGERKEKESERVKKKRKKLVDSPGREGRGSICEGVEFGGNGIMELPLIA